MRGIEISDGTLMLDLIDQVEPAGEFIFQRKMARSAPASCQAGTVHHYSPAASASARTLARERVDWRKPPQKIDTSGRSRRDAAQLWP